MLTIKQVAERLGVAPGTVYQLCASGQLVHLRIGTGRGTIRVEPEAVDGYIAAARVTAQQEKSGGFRHLKF